MFENIFYVSLVKLLLKRLKLAEFNSFFTDPRIETIQLLPERVFTYNSKLYFVYPLAVKIL